MPVVGRMTRAEALEASIEKWRQIEAGTKRECGSHDCALCQLYLKDVVRDCALCPVYEKTGRPMCRDTPYMDWYHAQGCRTLADTDLKRDIARREREFLESLREEEHGCDGQDGEGEGVAR